MPNMQSQSIISFLQFGGILMKHYVMQTEKEIYNIRQLEIKINEENLVFTLEGYASPAVMNCLFESNIIHSCDSNSDSYKVSLSKELKKEIYLIDSN